MEGDSSREEDGPCRAGVFVEEGNRLLGVQTEAELSGAMGGIHLSFELKSETVLAVLDLLCLEVLH